MRFVVLNPDAERREGLKALLRQIDRRARFNDAPDWRSAERAMQRFTPNLIVIDWHDGTLATRFGEVRAAHELQAKTGSLTHVNALSGYARSRRYGDVAFAIFVNNTPAANSEVRSVIDRIGLALVQ